MQQEFNYSMQLQGMTQEQAEAQAFLDFQEVTEVSQQSARPDMTSQQQASWIGKLVLNFLKLARKFINV